MKHTIKLLQWNILADGLSAKLPTLGGFVHEGFNQEIIQWDHRRNLIIAYIRQNNPDIFCLQEADHWIDDLNYSFKDYDYVFCPKNRHINDGLVIAFRKKTFSLMGAPLTIKMGSQVAISIRLVHLASCKEVVVTTTHLKSLKTEEGEHIRLEQIKRVLESSLNYGTSSSLHILAMDGNGKPDGLMYEEVSKYMKSSFNLDELQFTTWKERKHSISKHIIDYIMYCGENNTVIDTFIEECDSCIPNKYFPSDHLYLVTTFLL